MVLAPLPSRGLWHPELGVDHNTNHALCSALTPVHRHQFIPAITTLLLWPFGARSMRSRDVGAPHATVGGVDNVGAHDSRASKNPCSPPLFAR